MQRRTVIIDGVSERLEYLRGELRAERISMGELLELQSMADIIPRDDVELLEAAGVPEYCSGCGRPYDGDTHAGDACDVCGASGGV